MTITGRAGRWSGLMRFAPLFHQRCWVRVRKASITELKAIMAQWAEDKRMEQFFREAELDVAMLDGQKKALLMERLQLARQNLSVDTAVERLLKWETPQERNSQG